MATIGNLERKAGIGSSDAERTAFWCGFTISKGRHALTRAWPSSSG